MRFNTKVETLEREGEGTSSPPRVDVSRPTRSSSQPDRIRRPVFPPGPPNSTRTIVQIHPGAYKNPSQLPAGDVLVVGAGNTGAELALEAASTGRRVWLSGRIVGQVPSFLQVANGGLFWFPRHPRLHQHVQSDKKSTPPYARATEDPSCRIRSKEVTGAGI